MPPLDEVRNLVSRFDADPKNRNINEETLCQYFLLPFFEILGWDISNKTGLNEVKPQYSLRTEDGRQAPDYAFCLDGKPKFFVEAKKPSTNIKSLSESAYQLRRYAWSAHLPVSILSDFDEFALYDCRVPPAHEDGAEIARIDYFEHRNLENKLENFYNLFSKEAVKNGSLDKYSEDTRNQRGVSEVDDEFLKEIRKWREILAVDIARNNQDLDQSSLNYVVQLTIDRIIFLRICEDRGIEKFGQLMSLQNGNNIYKRLISLYHNADEKYNSGLFHFRKEKDREDPDDISLDKVINDNTLVKIFKRLYFPESPYEFSVFSAEILGQVYEQFLGEVIVLNENHEVEIVQKPEVRKAGGVYYTPRYIVDYIVNNTVGKLFENKTAKEARYIHILDPACGSGSFLLGAFDYLLDWYRKKYSEDGIEKHEKELYVTKEGEVKLTVNERKRILLAHLYGVDIDSQAVEVTKLSLLLKVLEGENDQTIDLQMKMFQERVLPDLTRNIKCGNSLIGTDFYEGKQNITKEEMLRINAFDWDKGFPEIMSKGGFDAVIGNPPWVDIKGLDKVIVKFYFSFYKTTANRINIFSIFIEKSLHLLNKTGKLGFIIPSSILTQSSYNKIRKDILDNYQIEIIVRLPDNVFISVKAETCILIVSSSFSDNGINTIVYQRQDKISEIGENNCLSFKQFNKSIFLNNNYLINVIMDSSIIEILKKIEDKSNCLSDICTFSLGITPYDKYKGHTQEEIRNRIFHSKTKISDEYKDLLSGEDIKRYYINTKVKEFIKYGKWLGAPREKKFFEGEKIFVRQIISGKPLRIYASYSNTELYITQIAFSIVRKSDICLKFVLGILNSKLMSFYHRSKFLDFSKNLFQKILIQDAKLFPFRILDLKNDQDKLIYSSIISLVDRILDLYKGYFETQAPNEKAIFNNLIEATDRQIDELVYKLYDLTDEEIRIIEGE
ncbi:MAG: N-6 DNA methylase [Candidatus Coatesbacteria bacterium]|nr:N-6 DNA methylase [Candidatus Coatesbacteria bacterium]